MAVQYTTANLVAAFLGWIDEDDARVTPDGTTLPTLLEIEGHINEAESYIDGEVNSSWLTAGVTVTDEYHPYRRHYSYINGLPISLRNQNVRSITSIAVWNGSEFIALTDAGSGPRDGQYWALLDVGIIYINSDYPTWGENVVKITYVYGKTAASLPKAIQRCATLLASTYLIEAGFDWTHQMVESSGSMSNREKAESWREQAEQIIERYTVSPKIPTFF